VNEDEAVFDQENAEQCLVSSRVLPICPLSILNSHPKYSLNFWTLSVTNFLMIMRHQLSACVSPAEITNIQLWVKYDSKQNRVRFEDSSCDFNKNVYATLVLSSIILLMFFIAVQVVSTEAAKKKLAEEAKSRNQPLPMSTVGFANPRQTEDQTNTLPLTARQRVRVYDTQLVFRHAPRGNGLRFHVYLLFIKHSH
jgi:hypothetical protein